MIHPAFDEDTSVVITLPYTDDELEKASSCAVSMLSHLELVSPCECALGICTVGVKGTSNFNGMGTFRYTVTTNGQVSAPVESSLTLNPVPDVPVAASISPLSFSEDTASSIPLSYVDPDGELATACTITAVSNVTVTTACTCVAGVCTVGIKGGAHFYGSASFSYSVSVNSDVSNLASATLTISSVPDLHTNISGLRLWLDFKDSTKIFSDAACSTQITNGGAIACVKDKSTTADTFLQTTGSQQPAWSSDSATFTRANIQYLISNASYVMPSRTIFIIQETTTVANYGTLLMNMTSFGSIANFFQSIAPSLPFVLISSMVLHAISHSRFQSLVLKICFMSLIMPLFLR